MAISIKWSPEAVEDLESIATYIARDSQFYANAVTTKIIRQADKIIEQPLAGRKVSELNDESIREYFIYSYRMIYKITETSLIIVAIIHGKRMLENIPNRF